MKKIRANIYDCYSYVYSEKTNRAITLSKHVIANSIKEARNKFREYYKLGIKENVDCDSLGIQKKDILI